MPTTLEKISSWDKNITNKLSVQSKGWKKLASFLALSGNMQPWIIVSVLFFIFDVFMKRSLNAYQVATVLTAGIFTSIFKVTVRRKRPDEEIASRYLAKANMWSFPSGHAGRMGAIAMVMILFYPTIGWLFILWGLGVGWARMTLKIHYFLDIVGGLLIGGVVGILGFTVSPYILPYFDFFNTLIPTII